MCWIFSHTDAHADTNANANIDAETMSTDVNADKAEDTQTMTGRYAGNKGPSILRGLGIEGLVTHFTLVNHTHLKMQRLWRVTCAGNVYLGAAYVVSMNTVSTRRPLGI